MGTTWTPLHTLAYTFVGAGIAGFAVLMRSNEPLTLRSVVGSILFYGCAGCVFGGFGMEYLGGRDKPWRAILCGMAVGLRIIKISDLTSLMRRILDGVDKGK